MYCIINFIVQGKQARIKNADLRNPSCTVVCKKRKSASPVLNVLNAAKRLKKKLFGIFRGIFEPKLEVK